jgi:hypothetical protein
MAVLSLPDPGSDPDPVYSDPLDALEKAEDTRIYNSPGEHLTHILNKF